MRIDPPPLRICRTSQGHIGSAAESEPETSIDKAPSIKRDTDQAPGKLCKLFISMHVDLVAVERTELPTIAIQ